jgi:L-asparaginase
VAAGAHGVVLAATGNGNGNHALVDWTREATEQAVAVGLSTRVPEGPVAPVYGNGGGIDLVNAGAVSLGSLPLFHGRLLIAALLADGRAVTPKDVADYT